MIFFRGIIIPNWLTWVVVLYFFNILYLNYNIFKSFYLLKNTKKLKELEVKNIKLPGTPQQSRK